MAERRSLPRPPTTQVEIRRGAYYDSIVLMEVQASLAALPGILRVGVMMGTAANKDVLAGNGLLTAAGRAALPDDLLVSVEAEDAEAAAAALAEVDALLARRRSAVAQAYLPRSLEQAARMLPEAPWVLVSVPGRYAAGVAREALRLRKHVFLYSDNVPLEDEIALKQEAAGEGLLVMGPDCGTALVGGVGLGFANRVRRGPVGLVGATGTGLQLVTARIHQAGSGVTHALGTGGRDLTREVGGVAARQALDLLCRDPETKVIVLLSKPPATEAATALLRAARAAGKPVVVNFQGYAPPASETEGPLHFAASLDEAAAWAVRLATASPRAAPDAPPPGAAFAAGQRYVRGLFSGGTLAYETRRLLQAYLPAIHDDFAPGHAVVDLGDDAFTVGRPHPMLDHTLRLERLAQEAADPAVAVVLLDVVLGYGAHPDPAAEIAPAIAAARAQAEAAGRLLEVVVVVVGTDEDPQDFAAQGARLRAAGARVETCCRAAAAYAGRRVQALDEPATLPAVDLSVLRRPLQALNVGLETFAASLTAQQASVVHVDWRPPAGGDERLMSILARLKQR